MASIGDIAARAGCHISTVSRALKGNTRINEKTREKIFRIARELDYTPNNLARGLAARKTYTIGLLSPLESELSYFREIFLAVQDTAKAHGYRVIVCNATDKYDLQAEHLRFLNEQRVDGMISLLMHDSRTIDIFRRNIGSLKYIIGNVQEPMLEAAPCVLWDYKKSVRLLVEHLASLGHRDIAVLSGPDWVVSYKKRTAALLKEAKRLGLNVKAKVVLPGFSCEEVFAAVKPLLKSPDFSAVCACNDMSAIWTLNCIKEAGFSVPDDISVTGYDNLMILRRFTPVSLTTIEPGKEEMGKVLCNRIIDIIEERDDEALLSRVEPKLVAGASTGAAGKKMKGRK